MKNVKIKSKLVKAIYLICAILLIISFIGCGSEREVRTLNVIAAASLTEVFTELGIQFQNDNPSIKINFIFAGSQDCITQIIQGMKVDIFASANLKYMNKLIEEGLVLEEESEIFAYNKLILISNTDYSNIDSLEDLATKEYKLSIADDSVPVGKYTLLILEKLQEGVLGKDYKNKVLTHVVSKETNVKSVAAKVELGEVDAGFVYTTDITSSNEEKLRAIKIPDECNIIASYPVAILKNSEKKDIAAKWIKFIQSEKGKDILKEYRFNIN